MSNALIELLNEINNELTNQISLVKNADAKIDTRKLFQLSNSTAKSLRYEKQDLERVISNLKDI
jgi:hypothetical protein